jgi:hypothetical protein
MEDLTADARHPGWSDRAAEETGIRSALSLPLRTGGSPGSLDLYSPRQHRLRRRDPRPGPRPRCPGGGRGAGAGNEEHLRTPITTRTVIGQAGSPSRRRGIRGP